MTFTRHDRRLLPAALGVLWSMAGPAAAGEITLDGEAIDEQTVRLASAFLLEPDERCPPESDALLRERMVEKLLLQREHTRQLKLSDTVFSREMLEQYATQDESVEEALGNDAVYAAAIYRFQTDHQDFDKVAPISVKEIEDAYERMLAARHPLLVDAVAVTFTAARAANPDERALAEEAIASGGGVKDIRRSLGYPEVGPLDGKRWIPVTPVGTEPVPDFNAEYWTEKVEGWSPDLAVGSILGPERRWLHPDMTEEAALSYTWYEIVDRRQVDRIELRGGPKALRGYAGLWIDRMLQTRRFDAMRKRLRTEADVRVDGQTVSGEVAFEGCAP